MPWEEIVFNNDYILSIVKCILCTKIGRKKNLFVLKWDYLEKRAKKKRNEYGQKIMDMKCAHAKMRFSVVTLALGSRPRQKACRGVGQD